MFEIASWRFLGTSSVSQKKSLLVDMHSTSHLMATGDQVHMVHIMYHIFISQFPGRPRTSYLAYIQAVYKQIR